MTATDQAFIRLFDVQAGPREMAPHVSFAARGVQLAAGFEPVLVWGGAPAASSAPVDRADVSTSAAPVAQRPKPRPVDGLQGAASHFPAAHAAPPPTSGTDTYLPSAYRNLVEVEEPARAHRPAAAQRRPSEPDPPAAHEPSHRSQRRQDPPEGQSRRRPLAELLYESPPPADFRPALEVDRLRWPAVVVRMLEECGTELAELADALGSTHRQAERVILFHSTQLQAGCTTLTLAVARLLACLGHSVAVVDGDFLRPQLAGAVGVALTEGWEATLRSGVALAESVIRSVEDRLSIVPLATPLSDEEICGESVAMRILSAVHQLAAHHDLVLIDGGCLASAEAQETLRRIFAAVADGRVLVAAEDTAGANLSDLEPGEGPLMFGIVVNRAAVP